MKKTIVTIILTFITTTFLWFIICPLLDNDFLENHNIIVKPKDNGTIIKCNQYSTSSIVLTLNNNGILMATCHINNSLDTILIHSKEELKSFFVSVRKSNKEANTIVRASVDTDYKNVKELMSNLHEIGEERYILTSF